MVRTYQRIGQRPCLQELVTRRERYMKDYVNSIISSVYNKVGRNTLRNILKL